MECYASPIITCYIYFFSFVKSLKFKLKKKNKIHIYIYIYITHRKVVIGVQNTKSRTKNS